MFNIAKKLAKLKFKIIISVICIVIFIIMCYTIAYLVSIEGILDLFGIGSSDNMSKVYTSSDILCDFIRSWEKTDLYNFYRGAVTAQEVPKAVTGDGKNYITYSDGNINIAYGLVISQNFNDDIFSEYGVTSEQLRAYGAGEVFEELLGTQIENLFIQRVSRNRANIESKCKNLNLNENQINALTAIFYQFGSIQGFAECYNEYGTTDELKNNWELNGYKPFVTGYGGSEGEKSRASANWNVFQGIEYRTRSGDILNPGSYTQTGSGNTSSILQAASSLHNAQTSWNYSTSDLPSGDIEKAINNPNKVTCCATYVSSVLYRAGAVSKDAINGINYNMSSELYKFLVSSGWKTVSSYDNLQAGDIVFMTSSGGTTNDTDHIGHVQIYAGNGTWYNAGSNDKIHLEVQPYSSDVSDRFIVAMRMK